VGGAGALSAASNAVTPRAVVPGAPTILTPTRGNGVITALWTAPANNGGAPITSYTVQVFSGNTVVRTVTTLGTATGVNVTGLTRGTVYAFRVFATNSAGNSPLSARSPAIVFATAPSSPTATTPTSGTAGGQVTATARWAAPPANNTGTGGSAITGYRVYAQRYLANGTTPTGPQIPSAVVGPNVRALVMSTGLLNNGIYRFRIVAINAVGESPQSGSSSIAIAR
jgi:hypothetical protein